MIAQMQGARSHYEVIVLGAGIPALAAGALLARRGFRVAWIRHSSPSNCYEWQGHVLRRATEALPFLDTPAWHAIANELSIQTAVRRVGASLEDGVTQMVLPQARLDIREKREELLHEFNREFPELQRPMEEWFSRVDTLNAQLDRALEPGQAWPPDGFFQRRATMKKLREVSEFQEWQERDFLGDFPNDHAFRTVIQAVARMQLSSDPDSMDALQMARAWGLTLRGMTSIDGGRDKLVSVLAERITQFGGVLRERERVAEVVIERGRVVGVRLAVTDEVIGCSMLLSSLAPEQVLSLARTEASPAVLELLSSAEPVYSRYSLNLVVRPEAIPLGLATRSFVVLDPPRPLAEENLLYLEHHPNVAAKSVTLTVHALLPRAVVDEGAAYLGRVRRRTMSALQPLFPFLARDLLAIDSPYDGLDLEAPAQDLSVRVEARWNGEAESMEPVFRRVPDSFAKWCALPVRAPIDQLYWLGSTAVPGLGEEGALLAAIHLSDTLTKADPAKARLRRELWKKA